MKLMGSIFIILSIILILYLYFSPPVEGFVDGVRCGVDLPPCSDGLRCMNGYCRSDIPPTMPAISDLPIKPNRYPFQKN
jgi:hypothetical protein